jgi:hypothetical protein
MDLTRWPLARSFPRPHAAMKRLIGLLIATTLESGCAAKEDWIDRTLVTVDVTGTWSGTPGEPPVGNPGPIFLDLKQERATVQGFLRPGGPSVPPGPVGGPISGTVAGDVFRFESARGIITGELTVHGDEMSGTVQTGGARQLTLRRIDPSSPPASPPR